MPLLNNRYEILDTNPLPDLDGPFARAYAAKGKGAEGDLMALICTTPIAARGDMANALRAINHPSLLRLRESGAMEWPATSGRAYAFVYDKAPGPALMPKGASVFSAMKEEPLIAGMVVPLFNVIHLLSGAGVFHGAIRPDNIFLTGSAGGETRAVLGDGLATPAGFGQPSLYNTIDRQMAEGVRRGAGTVSDDFYALGVTLLAALCGEEPLKGLPDAAILNLKLERGSYAALAGEKRFSPGVVELLRGLMADDPTQRWTFADFEMWMEGRRLTPRQSMAARKATRAFTFAGQNYLQPRQLAMVLAQNSVTAAGVLKGEDIGRWLAHGLHDEAAVAQLEEARGVAKRMRVGPEDERLVAASVMTLDPAAPIRYRGIALFPSGLASSMAEATLKEEPLQPYVEILLNNLPGLWLAAQAEKRPEMVGLVQMVERCKDNSEKPGLGFGPERALYDMNPMQPCLSPLVRDFYAVNMKHLLEGLDRRGAGDGAFLVDRHVAAFMLSRDRKIMPQVMRAVETANDTGKKGIALLTLFADLQYRHGPEKLRGLARALLPLADEVVRRFQNRPRQGKIREALRPAAEAGDMPGMLKLVDDPATLQLDSQEYEAARILYRETEDEIARLSTAGMNKKLLSEAAGQPLAAVVSVALAFALAIYLLLNVFMGNM